MALVVKYPLANAGDTRDESFDLYSKTDKRGGREAQATNC